VAAIALDCVYSAQARRQGGSVFYRTVLAWTVPLSKEIVSMCVPIVQSLSSDQLADLHTRFLVLLPRIETHGRIYFRHLRSNQKDEVFQEMRALGWLVRAAGSTRQRRW
jgi:hypothetical protein